VGVQEAIMFGWLRRTAMPGNATDPLEKFEQLLELPVDRLIDVLGSSIRDADDASRAMYLLAYPTAKNLLDFIVQKGAADRASALPSTYRDAVRFAFEAARDAKGDVGQRRATWLALASALAYASHVHREAHLNEAVAAIWMDLFEAKAALKRAVNNNVLFDDLEKAYFTPTDDDRTFGVAMAFVAPKHLRQCKCWKAEYR
jgi:hypothetical protein